MLQEYALEPSLLSSWSDFRFFVSQFGFDRGRLIARYPKKWKRMVYESLGDCKDIERAKIEEGLRRIDDRLVPRHASSWEASREWLANAEAEHEIEPFWAIVAQANQRSHSSVIVGATIDDTLDLDSLPDGDSRRLWKSNRSRIINRSAAEMANAVETLLKHAEKVLFVDKHFGPENARHRGPFREFLGKLDARPGGGMPQLVEVHCGAISELDFFSDQCQSRLAKITPQGLKIGFHRWSPDNLHNRFILTDLGGVAFLEGLDEFMRDGRPKDIVVLLDNDVAQKLIEDYTPGSSKFQRVDYCEVVGSRPA